MLLKIDDYMRIPKITDNLIMLKILSADRKDISEVQSII